jgi:hypothetical protein
VHSQSIFVQTVEPVASSKATASKNEFQNGDDKWMTHDKKQQCFGYCIKSFRTLNNASQKRQTQMSIPRKRPCISELGNGNRNPKLPNLGMA